jgi:hypothetical protein
MNPQEWLTCNHMAVLEDVLFFQRADSGFKASYIRDVKAHCAAGNFAQARRVIWHLKQNPYEPVTEYCDCCGRELGSGWDQCGGPYRVAVDDWTCANERRGWKR